MSKTKIKKKEFCNKCYHEIRLGQAIVRGGDYTEDANSIEPKDYKRGELYHYQCQSLKK